MLKMNGLEMPPTFPETAFETIFETVNAHHQLTTYFQFHGAWNAVAYRFHAMTDCDQSFTASLKEHGPAPVQPIRYGQERDLFGFVSNAYSMFDAFHYGMYAVGAFVDSAHFKLASPEDERKVTFGTTSRAYASAFNGDPIIDHFLAYWSDPARQDLDVIRNMLTHRAVPPRAFRLTLGGGSQPKPAAAVTRLMLELDQNTTATRAADITALLSRCLTPLQDFTDRML